MLAKEFHIGGKLPKDIQNIPPPIGWYESEKFDGYRTIYDKTYEKFISRNDKEFHAPQWFLDSILSENSLDGELWAGRNNFDMMGIVRKKEPIDEEWFDIQYLVYDIPDLDKPFEERLKELKKIVVKSKIQWNKLKKDLPSPYCNLECPIVFAEQTLIKSQDHFQTLYDDIISKGGEGIMLKHPSAPYINKKRSSFMLKVKPAFDSEAIIIDHKEGKGKYKGLLGGFICRPLINKDTFMVIDTNDDHIFSISGMDDNIRNNYLKTHPVNTIITLEYSEMTAKGVPRFGRYIRKRSDVIIKDISDMNESNDILKNILLIFNKLSNYHKSNQKIHQSNAYQKAIQSLSTLLSDSDLDPDKLMQMSGIGKGILEKIIIIKQTGTHPDYEKVKDYKDPKEALLKIHGVGPKKATELIKQGFNTIEKIKQNDDLSKILNDTQLIGLSYYDDINERIPREEIINHEIIIRKILYKIDPLAELTIAGSYRRGNSDSGDIDVLIKAKTNKTYHKFIESLKNCNNIHDNYLKETLSLGPKKFMGITDKIICSDIKSSFKHRRIDIMYTKPEEYPFAILYFTGSKDYNTKVRKIASDKSLSINEYHLKYKDTGKKIDHSFHSEKEIIEYLGLNYLEPIDR
jgi:DNA polymerase/3'-5' exonuclease PolX